MDSEPVSIVGTRESLKPEAGYGRLPFDRFVLEHWQYERPAEQDQQQWDELARTWLALDHTGRNPYWEQCFEYGGRVPEGFKFPTQDQINRVLVPHQTIKERNLCWSAAGYFHDPVWLRTCYAPDLASAYEEMIVYNDRNDSNHTLRELDDESLYGNFGQDWARVFLRLPVLPDTIPYMGDPKQDIESSRISNNIEPPEEKSEMPLYEAVLKERTAIYILDEEALQAKVIKIYWVDFHGSSVWYNKMEACSVEGFEAQNIRLWEILGNCYDDPALREPGAMLYYD